MRMLPVIVPMPVEEYGTAAHKRHRPLFRPKGALGMYIEDNVLR